MGFLDSLMGNASTANKSDVQKDLQKILSDGETVDVAFK